MLTSDKKFTQGNHALKKELNEIKKKKKES